MSTPRTVTVFGAGGHARVVIDVLRAAGHTVTACLAPTASEPLDGVPVIDEDAGIAELQRTVRPRVFIAIGDNVLRRKTAMTARSLGFDVISVISPHAYVASDVNVGSGTIIVHGAVVNPGTTLGEDVIVNTGASIDHDNVIEDAVHIAPGSHLAGSVRVGCGAFIGVGTAVIPGTTIGAGSMVGAGSVVVRDIQAGSRVWGNPAREKEVSKN